MESHIPTLDIRRYDSDRDAFVAELGAAYREWGFAGIRGHDIPQSLIERAYDAFVRFFALPTEVKMKYHLKGTGGARGYTPFGIETAKDSRYPDLKEFFHIGRELPHGSKFAGVMAPNIWPIEVSGLHEDGYALYQALDALGTRVLRALALHIGLPEKFFDDKTNFGNSILRPIHYPPITSPDIPNVRAGAHEDINFITLLVGASAAGLEVKSQKRRMGAVHRRRRHHRGQYRRHAATPDQPCVSVDHASRRQSAGRSRAPAALFGAVLSASQSGCHTRSVVRVCDAGQSASLRHFHNSARIFAGTSARDQVDLNWTELHRTEPRRI